MKVKLNNSQPIYFFSNKSTKTIGGVQTRIRLIEESMPEQKFIEIPLINNKKENQLERLPNVKIYNRFTDRGQNQEFEPNSKIIVFGVQKLFFLPKDVLANNEIIIFQANRADVTFGTIASKRVPFVLMEKVKYIDKFLFYTEEDKKEIIQILDNSNAEYHFKSYIVPNPSKTPRKKTAQYSNYLMYLGRFDRIQKNIKEYVRLAERISPEYMINAYGSGNAQPLLERSKVNEKGIIEDISQVAHENSILLLLSNYEGFGNVIVEAFSVGMPVIVYDSYPAARSIVTNGAGKLVPYGDLDGVEKAIKDILKDKETYQSYSDQAFEESKKYEKNKIINRYIETIWD